MASVSTPDIQDVLRTCGLAEYVIVDTDAEQLLDTTISDAVGYTALAVGEGTYDSTSLTTRQARLLKRAVTLRAGGMALLNPRVRSAIGTPEALLNEGGTAIEDAAGALIEQAEQIETLIGTGSDTPKPFALPQCVSSTFSVVSGDRTPSELNALESETDDVSAWDTDNG